MKKVRVCEVGSREEENDFIKLPWKIYRDYPAWVPPLISEVKKSIRGESNTLRESGPYTLLIAYKEGEVCGRLCAGINNVLNNAKGYKEGYVSLFECINDEDVFKALMDAASKWFQERGMERIIGPLSLPDGDDNRGVLIDNFDDPPMVMNVYNPPYYSRIFENYGFYKYWDCYAYNYDLTGEIDQRLYKVTRYAMKKYGFRIDPIDLKNIDKEIRDVKEIIDCAMPEEWEDFIPPDDDAIKVWAKSLVPVADPGLICIARTNDGKPIGFDIALPDYNQALKYVNGRLFPFGFVKFLYYKSKINRARCFVLFVVPEYRKKGVAGAIYLKALEYAKSKGYTSGEGSTIWEYNTIMRRDAESVGGKIYKTYRIYKKDL